MWLDVRPYLGHMLIGMAVGILACILIITIVASTLGVALSGSAFMSLSLWVVALFIVASVVGAMGVTLYMSPLDRDSYHARHALSRSAAR